MGKGFSGPGFDLVVKPHVLGGLGHDDGLIENRQGVEFRHGTDHHARIAGISHQPHHFGMVPVPDDNGGKALAGMNADDGLDPDHARTGGIHHPESGILEPLLVFRGHSVSPDQHGPGSVFGNRLQDRDALFRKQSEHLGIVDQRAIGVYGRGVFARRVQGHFHCPPDTHAEPGGLGNLDLHR